MLEVPWRLYLLSTVIIDHDYMFRSRPKSVTSYFENIPFFIYPQIALC